MPPPDPSEILSWLCCDPLPPIPLGPKPIITIGRSDKCDLVLPHKEVSRVHALIKIRLKAKMIVIEDEGSSNGTFVNGKRAPSSILREGDEITLGPYEIVVRSLQEMRRRDDDDGESTNSLELTAVARILPSAAMTGLLQEVPMTEVLQGIEFNKKSGTLSVTSPDRVTGVLVFAEGKPMYAGFGELRDDEAVLGMIGLSAGSFAVTGDVEPGEKRMQISITGLLLEASRRIDEAEGGEGSDDESDDEDVFAFGFESEDPAPELNSGAAAHDSAQATEDPQTQLAMEPLSAEQIEAAQAAAGSSPSEEHTGQVAPPEGEEPPAGEGAPTGLEGESNHASSADDAARAFEE